MQLNERLEPENHTGLELNILKKWLIGHGQKLNESQIKFLDL